MKLYENLQQRAFNITMPTGQPNIPIPRGPWIKLDPKVAEKYPQWFKEVIEDEEPKELKDIDDGLIDDEEVEVDVVPPVIEPEVIEDPIADDEILADIEEITDKKDLDEYALIFDIKLDRRMSIEKMKEDFKVKLEEKESDK